MKLKKMNIINYRQFRDITINYHDTLTILAGANNSGKTSLIELYNAIFSDNDKRFSKDDISIVHLNSSIKQLYTLLVESQKELLKESYSLEQLEVIFEKKYQKLLDENEAAYALIIYIEVSYNKEESIAFFSDYLMELADENTSFYFEYTLELNFNNFKKLLSDKIREVNEYLVIDSDESMHSLNLLLLDIYEKSLKNKVYFTDSSYNHKVAMTTREFRKLFHFGYIKATRLLNDEKNDTYFSLSKEVFSNFKLTDKWEELKTELPNSIHETLDLSGINKLIKENSLDGLDKVLKDISNILDYEPSTFFLQSEINEEILVNFLLSILRTNYEFEGNNILKESTQGLGVSNLIFICLRIDRFIKKYDSRKVNFFVIEEPEAHMHPQMEHTLVNYLKNAFSEKELVQGIITTHSHEIVKSSKIDNIRVLRVVELFNNKLYDMSRFKEGLSTDDEKDFFTFLFSINYSNLIFANKIIMYEGDTEKIYLENLLNDDKFNELSQQYISFVQVGGAYAHWYRKLIYFLGIKTLILTDIDYSKSETCNEKILKSQSTNEGLKEYYKDSQTLVTLKKEYLTICDKCQDRQNDCYYHMPEYVQIEMARNIKQPVCEKIPINENLKKIQKSKISIQEIYLWIQENDLIRIYTQTKDDASTRTLEEALLCKLLKMNIEDKKTQEEWKKIRKDNKLKFTIPRKAEKILSGNENQVSVRDIVNSTGDDKTDFIYSVVLGNMQNEMLPNYIEEGLNWLTKK